jgi:dCMP deaminase
MDKWDKRFLGLAEHIAGWSKDPSTKVGAVIADRHNRVVSVGYNGLPRGVEDSGKRLSDRTLKYPLTIHAEENAILFANRSLDGCTLYVWPLPPCAPCAAKIVQVGITLVVSVMADADAAGRWTDSNVLAWQLFKEAGVKLALIKREELA